MFTEQVRCYLKLYWYNLVRGPRQRVQTGECLSLRPVFILYFHLNSYNCLMPCSKQCHKQPKLSEVNIVLVASDLQNKGLSVRDVVVQFNVSGTTLK
jgi:hypothetical protein